MTSAFDRLRRLQNLRTAHNSALEFATGTDDDHRDVGRKIPGQELFTAAGPCYVSTHAFPLDSLRGGAPLGAVLGRNPQALARLNTALHQGQASSFRHAVFLDTETTGLGTGASVYAFMIGIGTFETLADPPEPTFPDSAGLGEATQRPLREPDTPTHFVVRQLFMRSPAEEQALLTQLATQLAEKQLVVTFNGRSFDLPLLRSRVRYIRPFLSKMVCDMPLLREDAPHIDLLLPARRLWRRRLQSCRLSNLEQNILGYRRREDDVPGYLIPQLYADYLRTGNMRQLAGVFYHNREDIVSMVSLAARLTEAFDDSSRSRREAELHPQDWLSLAMTYERLDDLAQAESAYYRALEDTSDSSDRSEIFFRLGRLQKRQGRWREAADTWQLWITSVSDNDPTPYVELAKYCEWQLRDYEQAEMWTAWALHILRQETSQVAWSRTIDELEHRLRRIRRKRDRIRGNDGAEP